MIGRTFEPAQVTLEGKAIHVSPEGYFAIGIAYDRTDPLHYSVILPNGLVENNWITPIARQYEVQAVNGLPQQFVTPSAEDLVRIRREGALIAEARTRDTDGVGFAEPFDWPFAGIVTSVYGSRRIENGTPMAPHLGVDIAAPEGTPIHAAADAVVSIADDYFLDGGFTLLDHGHGVSSCYLHQSKRLVTAGDMVARGEVIGLVGQTGRATGPHTHWGLNWFQVKLDPSRSTPTPEPPKA
ncbi:MAG: M23 family metallopeptidase [Alphaproteobacteria bacterium]|nr:M23 family metallopeptidase [Alphaproteobacteria bacterium]